MCPLHKCCVWKKKNFLKCCKHIHSLFSHRLKLVFHVLDAFRYSVVKNTIKKLGLYLKNYRGADIGIVLVFLFSGLALKTEEIKKGLTDIQVTLISLLIIFVIAPLLAMLINLIPLAQGIKIGIFLVAVMPTTLSTGVVMTSAAGGNMAQALFITVSGKDPVFSLWPIMHAKLN